MAEILQFKTESKRLLDLMINSIYTNKEIFLREIISNASDAIDKYHYLSLTGDKLPKNNDYEIFITIDKNNKTLTISDNGIGMTKDELINSLGTIAKSGSLEFMEKLKENKDEAKDIDITTLNDERVTVTYEIHVIEPKETPNIKPETNNENPA